MVLDKARRANCFVVDFAFWFPKLEEDLVSLRIPHAEIGELKTIDIIFTLAIEVFCWFL